MKDIKKGNLVRVEEYVCKDIQSTPKLIKRTGIIVNCHGNHHSVVFLDTGSLAVVQTSLLEFIDDGGDFFLKQVEEYFIKNKD